eukprot:Skav232634  [mRNA]  locus=scaffold12:201712:203911:+ [translate_table: standard]
MADALDALAAPDAAPRPRRQRVSLQCPDQKQFGLLLGGHPQMEGLVVVDVLPFSVVREWNRQNPSSSIDPGMLVLEVNGIREATSMLQQFREARCVVLQNVAER